MLMDAGLMVVGLVVLVIGADVLVRGASTIAQKLGVRPAVVGLTVVAWGTSFPELMISVQASLGGYADLAIGNVVGSNFYNITLIVGLSALISGLNVQRETLRLDLPAMLAATLAFWLVAIDRSFSQIEGALFVVALIGFTGLVLWQMPPEGSPITSGFHRKPAEARRKGWKHAMWPVWAIGSFLVGVVFLGYGARWFTDGAVHIAETLGVSKRVIGLTLVALGTSLPELATSIVAALRGHADIAVSNVVGSNLLNILVIVGVAAMIKPIDVSETVLNLDMPMLLAISVLFAIFLRTERRVTRLEGFILLALGVGYTLWLI
ncbi:MAG: calcium/sodium antiporter [Myxococcota bacterium]